MGNRYIEETYKRGVIRARQELIKAGHDVPTIEESGGIDVVMKNPYHIERLSLLFMTVFNDLKAITGALNPQISKVLTQGLLNGDSPAILARKLISVVKDDQSLKDILGKFIPSMRRAEMLARTSIIMVFAESELQEFENWGIEEVVALVEFQNAGDNKVCDICEHLGGTVFTIKEARGIIPVHVRCRCCWILIS